MAQREAIKTITNRKCPYYFTCELAKSIQLRALSHFVGDLHQPLHAVSRYNKKYPDGDLGGNKFLLNFGYYKNLHMLWDAIVALDKGSEPYVIKIKIQTKEIMIKNATDIMNEFPKSGLIEKIKILDPNEWAKESYKVANEFVYRKIEENSAPSEEYLTKGQKYAKERIALAGYRLARLFEEAYNNRMTYSTQDIDEME